MKNIKVDLQEQNDHLPLPDYVRKQLALLNNNQTPIILTGPDARRLCERTVAFLCVFKQWPLHLCMKYVQTMVPHVESNVDVKRFITRGDGGKLEG